MRCTDKVTGSVVDIPESVAQRGDRYVPVEKEDKEPRKRGRPSKK